MHITEVQSARACPILSILSYLPGYIHICISRHTLGTQNTVWCSINYERSVLSASHMVSERPMSPPATLRFALAACRGALKISTSYDAVTLVIFLRYCTATCSKDRIGRCLILFDVAPATGSSNKTMKTTQLGSTWFL